MNKEYLEKLLSSPIDGVAARLKMLMYSHVHCAFSTHCSLSSKKISGDMSPFSRYSKGLTAVIIAICLSGFFCCSSSPEAQINKVLDKRKQGLEQKDIELYMSTVSLEYNDGREKYVGIKQKTAGFFDAFDEIELTIEDRSIYVDADSARVVEKYILAFSLPSGKKMGKAEQLFTLRKEKDGWKIIKGLGKQ